MVPFAWHGEDRNTAAASEPRLETAGWERDDGRIPQAVIAHRVKYSFLLRASSFERAF